MSRRMTNDEALEVLEVVFEVGPETIVTGLIEGFVLDMEPRRARADIESFLAIRPGDIDPDSIEIHNDYSDEADMDGIRIVIRTEG